MIAKSQPAYLRFMRFLLPYRLLWLGIFFLGIAGSLVSLVIPYLTKGIVDTSIANRDFASFVFYAVVAGAIFLIGESINWLRFWLEQLVKTRVTVDLNRKVFEHLAGLSYSWFQQTRTGEHMFTLHYDIETTVNLVTTNLPQTVSLVPRAALTMVIVFVLDWRMALCTLVLGPLLFVPAYFYNRILARLSQAAVAASEKIMVALQDIFSHILLIKVWGTEKRSTRNFLHAVIVHARLVMRSLKPEIANGIVSQILTKAVIAIFGLIGGYLVISGTLSLGSLTAIMVYLAQLVGLQSQFVSLMQNNIAGMVSCERLAKVLDIRPQVTDAPGARNLECKKGEIVFRKVSFGYRADGCLIQGLDFVIPAGGYVALVGPSGSGKTTLINLLVRLYDPWEGTISIDGHDVREVTLRSLRAHIGVALQEHFLWDDTILNNIAYGGRAHQHEVEEVARICGVDDFVKRLPAGYQTVIGENACRLSEGQKQKIAIARALFKKPKILVLDEAMAAMDSESEERIMSHIRSQYPQMTILIVSHRFSTIRNCDRVLYLTGQGAVIEGSITSLLESNPGFRSLFAGQIEGK